jgi:hypothetical protein
MASRHQGSGSSKTELEYVERSGYILIVPQDQAHLPADIALVMNMALNDWLKKNPNIRVRAVLPITRDGQTTAIHLRYDQADGSGK